MVIAGNENKPIINITAKSFFTKICKSLSWINHRGNPPKIDKLAAIKYNPIHIIIKLIY